MNRNIHHTNGAHTFLTIREAAKQPECPYGETKLRQMQKEGMLPGIWNGNRFLINFPHQRQPQPQPQLQLQL